ncbi:MAG TPA: penicillin acylase family protein, partial [Streptomyces sp.]|nr:penicillin acylase family protein [Streptomyces sp.]
MPVMKTSRRARLIVITVVLLLVAGIGGGTFWTISTVRDSFPQTTGSLKLKGLNDPVTVQRDREGIPQVYADSSKDLFTAQGYVQAQDRFWEMDVRRHMTSGRLSEMFGASQVKSDAFLRTLGWRRVAEREYAGLSRQAKDHLKAYSAGVNAYLKDHKDSAVSLEYAALDLDGDYTPHKWSPVDSVAWLKAMAWDLRANMSSEIDRALMSSRLTRQQIEELYPEYPYDRNKPVTEGGIAPGRKTYDPKGDSATSRRDGAGAQQAVRNAGSRLGSVATQLDKIPALLGPSNSGIGSNSWVVSGDYTTTGKPLLANDP